MIDDLFLSFGRTRGEIDRFGRTVSRRSVSRNNGSGVERKIRAVVWIRPASFLGFFPDNLRKYKGSLGGTGGSTLLSPSCQQINVLGLQKRAVGRDFRRGPTNTFLKFTLNLETPRTYVSSRAENTRMGRMDDKHRGKISVDGKRLGILGVDYYERSMDITSEPTYLSEDRQFSHDGGIP